MLTLFSNAFSPFARKVAMALEYKGLACETVDGLARANRERLLAVNPRAEVPVLVDGDVTFVNSSDILIIPRSRACARGSTRWVP